MSPHGPENDETLEALASRLRRLPPPPVPPGLEGRLLADIPAPRRRGGATRFWVAAGVLLTAAAAVLFAVRLPPPVEPRPPRIAAVEPAPTLWTYEQALRRADADPSVVLDRAAPPFVWPVAGTCFLSDRYAGPTD